MKHKKLIWLPIGLLFIFACNLPSSTPTQADADSIFTQAALTVTAATQQNQAASPTAATQQESSNTPVPTNTTAASNTQQTGATNTSVPCNRASFVSDVTIDDGTSITVNKAFTKTWKLKNVGSCTWTSGYSVIFDSGDKMGGPDSQQLTNGTVLPGQTIDLSINLTAPSSTGTYKGNWKLKDPNGEVFALSTGPFWVQIKAVAASPWPILKNGATGPEVYAIQYLLLAHGLTVGVDGIWGTDTQNKVEDFQTQNNLKEDGIVGPETWQALIIQVKQGDTGPEVRAVQYLLRNKFGDKTVNVDGIFGPLTDAGVKNFQTSKGLSVDGIVGPKTWEKLIGG